MERQIFGGIDGSIGYRTYPLPYGFGSYPTQNGAGGYPTEYAPDDYGINREISFPLNDE